ncbi:hypothetical protein C3L33_02949, partial [Rhododendron williamsianum]
MDTNPQGFHEETSFLSNLPKTEWKLAANTTLLHWKGFWLMPVTIKSAISVESQFNPLSSDILLASFPKTGTTWLKALATTILSHDSNPKSDSQTDQLQTHNPHELIPFLEMETFGENASRDINQYPSPRVFSTHLPYSILPESIKNSGCRIIYISRNPATLLFPVGISLTRDLVLKSHSKRLSMSSAMELLWEVHLSIMCWNIGLSGDEIEQVVWKCSHERLSKLDVNKDEDRVQTSGIKFSSYFRTGVVGDGKKLLSPEMMERIENLSKQRWEGSGLEL